MTKRIRGWFLRSLPIPALMILELVFEPSLSSAWGLLVALAGAVLGYMGVFILVSKQRGQEVGRKSDLAVVRAGLALIFVIMCVVSGVLPGRFTSLDWSLGVVSIVQAFIGTLEIKDWEPEA